MKTKTNPTERALSYSKEELQSQVNEFRKFINRNQNVFGDYHIQIHPPSDKGFSVTMFSFIDPKIERIKDRTVIEKGVRKETICHYCEYKLACLLDEELYEVGICSSDIQVRDYISNELSRQFDFDYPKNEIIQLFKNEGFKEFKDSYNPSFIQLKNGAATVSI